jgi:hypothetical protein
MAYARRVQSFRNKYRIPFKCGSQKMDRANWQTPSPHNAFVLCISCKERKTLGNGIFRRTLALKINAWLPYTKRINSVSRGKFSLLLIWNIQDMKQCMHLYGWCCTYAILPYIATDMQYECHFWRCRKEISGSDGNSTMTKNIYKT